MGRNAKNNGQADLCPVPVYLFWGAVIAELNLVLKKKYRYPYVYEVYKGQKINADLDAALDSCIIKVTADFANRGIRPWYPITPRKPVTRR